MQRPQITVIVLLLLGIIIVGYKHGEDRTGKHNVGIQILAACIMAFLLYMGGFFG